MDATVFMTIAMLCGSEAGGNSYSLSRAEVVECQKYYLKCAFKKTKELHSVEDYVVDSDSLRECILRRK